MTDTTDRLRASIENAPTERHRAIWQKQLNDILAGEVVHAVSAHGSDLEAEGRSRHYATPSAPSRVSRMDCPRCEGPTSVAGQPCGEC